MGLSERLKQFFSSQPVERASVINYLRLFETIERDQHSYAEADPFPHIVIDNFLDQDVLQEVIDHFPAPEHESWVSRNAQSDDGKHQQRYKFDYVLGRGILKQRPGFLEYEMQLHPTIRQLLLELNSITFLGYLQRLTRIGRLISDPAMWGGGLHQTSKGGLLNIHADFLKHPAFGFDRRLNFLLYLNDEWPEAWAGELELWSTDMKQCMQSIAPIANRCVIFTTSEHSYHGHSKPLACPDDVFRRSMAAYYYTVPGAGPVEKAVTDWQDRPDS